MLQGGERGARAERRTGEDGQWITAEKARRWHGVAAGPQHEATTPDPQRDGLIGLLMIEITGYATVEALEGGDAAAALRTAIEMRLWQAVPEDAITWPMGRARFAMSLSGTDRRSLERLAKRLRRKLENRVDEDEGTGVEPSPCATPTRILIGGAIAAPQMAVTLGATASRALDQARGDSSGVVVRARRKPSGAAARGRPPRTGRGPITLDPMEYASATDGAALTAARTAPLRQIGRESGPLGAVGRSADIGARSPDRQAAPATRGLTALAGLALRPVTPCDRPESIAFDLVAKIRGGAKGMPLFDATMRVLAQEPTRRLAVERPIAGSGGRLRDRLRVLSAMVPGLLDRLILVFPVDRRVADTTVTLVAALRRLGPAIALRPRTETGLAALSQDDGPLASLKPDFLMVEAGLLKSAATAAPALSAAKGLEIAIVAELPDNPEREERARRLGVDYILHEPFR